MLDFTILYFSILGRRKRDSSFHNSTILKSNTTHFSLTSELEDIFTIRLPQNEIEEFIEELPLGIVVTMNAWHLVNNSPCLPRNFCEYGLNCATFGPGAQFVGEFGSVTMSRWLATSDFQENELQTAFNRGLNLQNCEELYSKDCHVYHWNTFIKSVKNNSSLSNTNDDIF